MFNATRYREVHGLKSFQSKAFETDYLVERLEKSKSLEGHAGCVNTVNFSEFGESLVSGSDDRRIIVWNWYTGIVNLLFQSSTCINSANQN